MRGKFLDGINKINVIGKAGRFSTGKHESMKTGRNRGTLIG
jgi:hypothetical protein